MPDRQLTFFMHPMSRARLTRWMLEETGLPYETVQLEYGTTMKSPEYLSINPMGKVPAVRHGDTVVTENAAICLYLADLVPERGLAPPVGSPERGSYYRWMTFTSGPLEAMLTAKQAGALAPARAAGYGADGDVLTALETALTGRDHLAGDRFTAVDLYVAGCLGYYMQIGAIAPRPAFTAYVKKNSDRPAAKRAAELDAALMPAPAQPG